MPTWPEVLIVDDEKTVQFLTSEVFRLEGISSATALNGCEAVDYLEQVREQQGALPRVIILDIMMPCMDGYQVYEALGDAPWLDGTTFIVVSAARDITFPAKRIPVVILYKPYEVAELLDLAKRLAPELFEGRSTS
jgi:CheY-like chemotaxis protein